jgi:protein ImuB
MAPRGCINVDRLPLQILLKDNPAWAGSPVAVTREEKPQSPILALNRTAREKGLAVGMTYASALSLVPRLRARAVPADRIGAARERIVSSLSAFTPDIEPCPFDMDAFWVSVDGLRSLFASESLWVEKVRDALLAEGFRTSVVLGFTRFGTYAIARSRSRSIVFASREEEHELMGRSSIDILPLSQRTKGTLRRLEVRTVRQFASLPAGETARRFGRDAGLLREAILSDDPLPIQPVGLKETVPCGRHLDTPLVDLDLLMAYVDELLAIEAGNVEKERSVVSGLTLILRTEEGQITSDVIRPAVPTMEISLLRRLILLRLSARQFRSGVQDIEIRCARTQPSRRQQELFSVKGRDLQAGARAFAAIRARFGNDSVASARARDSWLPEKSFAWVPVKRPVLPSPRRETTASGRSTAVRRILFSPAKAPQARPAGGAFTVSGGWWDAEGKDAPYVRDYFYLDSPKGMLWLFVDGVTGACWVQGDVD